MLESDPPHTLVYATGAIAIGYHGQGLGGAMLDEIERRASELATRACGGGGGLAHGCVGRGAAGGGAAPGARPRGGAPGWSMTITFDRAPAPPQRIPGVEIRPMAEGDEVAGYECLADPFQDHWGEPFPSQEQWLHRHMTGAQQFDPTLWWIAWHNRQAVGALVAHLDPEEDPGLAHVGALGVRRPGVARASAKRFSDRLPGLCQARKNAARSSTSTASR